ncbi:MAG TPA: hypothetical protein VM433_00570 [Mycobacteriales bacterium]|nr:hypothetical protein [Mycobacteriales bacterium]
MDRHAALVSSADLTGAALGRNLECGVLVSGGPVPTAVLAHVEGLLAAGQLDVA